MKPQVSYSYGRNAIRASLECGRVSKLFVAPHLMADPLVAEARSKKVEVAIVNDAELTRLSGSSHHQGFVALCEESTLSSLEEIIASAKGKSYPLILILDGIEDPQNLGAILRSADAFGVDGIIMKSHGQVQLNGTVAKVSTGAINYVKVAVVANLSQSIEVLKKAGYWIVASDGSAQQAYDQIDYRSPIALVVGSEGFGIAPLVLKHSDFVVKVPMVGHVNSLNASVAAGIFLAYIQHSRQ
jgi:23S rRNA (guanosine2251-2'-O)-methyltransferase